MSGAVGMAFMMFSAQIARDGEKWEESCEKQRERIMKRWEKRQQDTAVYHGIPDDTGYTDTEKNTDTETEKETATEKDTATETAPPTLAEVTAYCRERRNSIDPQHFVDHYTANGWMIGKSPMRDWRAAVRRWEQNGILPLRKAQKPAHSSIDLAEAERLINKNI